MKKSNGGDDSSMIYLIYCKNPCKCHNVPPPSTTVKKKKVWRKVRVAKVKGGVC
jgi:hypothetical protein